MQGSDTPTEICVLTEFFNLQAAWRAKRDLAFAKAHFASQWQQHNAKTRENASRYAWHACVLTPFHGLAGVSSDKLACRSAVALDSSYLQSLWLCLDMSRQEDVDKLAQAAQLVLSIQDESGKKFLA